MSVQPWDPDLGPLQTIVASMGSGTADLYGARQERKLVLDPAQAMALRAAVMERLPLEQYVPGRRKTRIHSIYFDSPDFELFRHAEEGKANAVSLKLRLRGYGDATTPAEGDPSRFLEAKLGVTTPEGKRLKRKARLALSDAKLATLLHPEPSYVPKSGRRFWKPLLTWVRHEQIRPRLSITYEREAYMDPQSGLRVTFDTGYRASVVEGASSPLGRGQGTLPGVVIVELKFLHAMPAWLSGELFRLGLPAEGQSFSKFRTAVPLLFPHLRPH